tara:strand:+ start:3822 stop:5450 length:1629 start_codon:yes stop_codon:yes gene_type:complete
MNNRIVFIFILIITLSIIGCKKEEITEVTERIENTVVQRVEADSLLSQPITVNYNPSGIAPLTAELKINTQVSSSISITVLGKNPISKSFYTMAKSHTIPVLGLYPDTLNKVLVTINTANQAGQQIIEIQTDSVSEYLPEVVITKANKALMEPGLNFNNILLTDGANFWFYPMAYDYNGDIRWYFDFESKGLYQGFRSPLELTDEGNLLFEADDKVVEYDMMGNLLKSVPLPSGFSHAHHDVIKIPNGNYVVAVSKDGSTIDYQGSTYSTVEDCMIEINGTTGALVREWDFKNILDIYRANLAGTITGNVADWFHQNAVVQDPADGNYIVSGRNQGLIKVNQNNELLWVMAPHLGWGNAGINGNGYAIDSLLLTALDQQGSPLSQAIQDGTQSSLSFEWQWGQHAPLVLPNGNILVFDNGFNRYFSNTSSPFSRAVEYEIDETNMTVKQVWAYGESRGADCFSPIISDVDYLPNTGNILFSPGIMFDPVQQNSKIIEVTRPGGNVVFEGQLNFKSVRGGSPTPVFGQIDITYRTERMKLYQD